MIYITIIIRIHVIAGTSYRSRTAFLFMELNLPKFHEIKLNQTAVFVYKCEQFCARSLSSIFENYFTTGIELHSHYTWVFMLYRTVQAKIKIQNASHLSITVLMC